MPDVTKSFGETARLIGVRGSPERDISSLGAVRQGPGTFRELFAWRVHLFGDERSIYLKRSDTF